MVARSVDWMVLMKVHSMVDSLVYWKESLSDDSLVVRKESQKVFLWVVRKDLESDVHWVIEMVGFGAEQSDSMRVLSSVDRSVFASDEWMARKMDVRLDVY